MRNDVEAAVALFSNQVDVGKTGQFDKNAYIDVCFVCASLYSSAFALCVNVFVNLSESMCYCACLCACICECVCLCVLVHVCICV